jgi:hypothetical protein
MGTVILKYPPKFINFLRFLIHYLLTYLTILIKLYLDFFPILYLKHPPGCLHYIPTPTSNMRHTLLVIVGSLNPLAVAIVQVLERHSLPVLPDLAPRGTPVLLPVRERSDAPRKLTLHDAHTVRLALVPLTLHCPLLTVLADVSCFFELERAIILNFRILW